MLKLKPKYGLCCIFRRFSAKKEYQKKVEAKCVDFHQIFLKKVILLGNHEKNIFLHFSFFRRFWIL
jgi:hypothetical protein